MDGNARWAAQHGLSTLQVSFLATLQISGLSTLQVSCLSTPQFVIRTQGPAA